MYAMSLLLFLNLIFRLDAFDTAAVFSITCSTIGVRVITAAAPFFRPWRSEMRSRSLNRSYSCFAVPYALDASSFCSSLSLPDISDERCSRSQRTLLSGVRIWWLATRAKSAWYSSSWCSFVISLKTIMAARFFPLRISGVTVIDAQSLSPCLFVNCLRALCVFLPLLRVFVMAAFFFVMRFPFAFTAPNGSRHHMPRSSDSLYPRIFAPVVFTDWIIPFVSTTNTPSPMALRTSIVSLEKLIIVALF